jgi:hypothetical protein
VDAQAGLDPCWSQTHYVGFVVTRLILITSYQDSRDVPIQHLSYNDVSGISTNQITQLLFDLEYFILFVHL